MQRQALRAIAHTIAKHLFKSHASGLAQRSLIDRDLAALCKDDPRNTDMTDSERERIATVLVPKELARLQNRPDRK
jgi:hypothetical protein